MTKNENLKCPTCGAKLSISKHYDATYEWFECPGCEGCFTYDELLEGGGDAAKDELTLARKKHKPQAEQKEEAHVGRPPEIPIGDMVQIMADEIEELFVEMGRKIDRVNAEDKATNLVRVMKHDASAKVRERVVPMVLCETHSE